MTDIETQADVAAGRTHESLRRTVHRHLDMTRATAGRPSTANLALMALIVANVSAMIAETVPAFATMAGFFRAFETFSVAVFSAEYALRVWACAEDARYSNGWRGRLRYMTSPMAIVDLLAVLPFYLPASAFDLRFMRVLRLFRVLRLAKLARYSTAFDILGAVIRAKRAELLVLLALLVVLVLCSSSLMYFAERHAQPDLFSSIPEAAWWSVITLTTIGYGDAVPITALGQTIGAFVAVFGIGLFALPAGMLGAAFTEELARRKSQSGHCPHCGRPPAG